MQVTRVDHLQNTSSNEELNPVGFEEHNDIKVEDNMNVDVEYGASTWIIVQGASLTKNISVNRGWTKEDMLKETDDVDFNGCLIRVTVRKYGTHQHQ